MRSQEHKYCFLVFPGAQKATELDCAALVYSGLGIAYDSLGDFGQAIEYNTQYWAWRL